MGHDTIFAANSSSHETTTLLSSPENNHNEVVENGGAKKRTSNKRQKRVYRTKEEQRMHHINVEKNNRTMMSQHFGVLKSLLPKSYVQKRDRVSVVGAAISYVKELELHLETLEARKFNLTQQQQQQQDAIILDPNGDIAINNMNESESQVPLYFRKLFTSPQYTWSQLSDKYSLTKSNSATANIEVNLVDGHATLRILMRKQLARLSKIVGFLEIIRLTVLQVNVITLDAFVFYSIRLKVEEGCTLDSAVEIANAVHFLLGLI